MTTSTFNLIFTCVSDSSRFGQYMNSMELQFFGIVFELTLKVVESIHMILKLDSLRANFVDLSDKQHGCMSVQQPSWYTLMVTVIQRQTPAEIRLPYTSLLVISLYLPHLIHYFPSFHLLLSFLTPSPPLLWFHSLPSSLYLSLPLIISLPPAFIWSSGWINYQSQLTLDWLMF